MTHELTTYTVDGQIATVYRTDDRQRAFTAYDRAVANHPGGRVTLMGDGLSRDHWVEPAPEPEAEPDEDRQAPTETGSDDRERAGDAPADAGDAPAAAPAAPRPEDDARSAKKRTKFGAVTSH